MSQKDITQLLQEGEKQTIEFKQSLGLTKEALQSLCGMVNADYAEGAVIFGVGPEGKVVGIEPGDVDKAQRSISQLVSSKFEPRLTVSISVHEVQGKRVLVLSAMRYHGTPYYEYDGRGYIREGTVTRVLTLAEKQELYRRRNRDLHPGPWQCDRCATWVGLLVSYSSGGKSYACNCGGEFWPAT